LQYGVACWTKQLPVPGLPQPSSPPHWHDEVDCAADTQALSHSLWQQNGSPAQTVRQQLSLEQFGVLCGVQQSGSNGSPHGATGHTALLPLEHVVRAVEAQTLSQRVSQQ
jgi:hypothetical protein